ncbi:hypothetical protein [Rhodococcus opacus]|nr:hypothetical protein [Rhodococcus opacus]
MPVLLMWVLLGGGWMRARILVAALKVGDEHIPAASQKPTSSARII